MQGALSRWFSMPDSKTEYDSNPDVAELIRANKAGCHHDKMSEGTRWLGGTSGRIGGQTPQRWWWCNECREWIRPWNAWVDDPKTRALAKRLERGAAYTRSLGLGSMDGMSPTQSAEYSRVVSQNLDGDDE